MALFLRVFSMIVVSASIASPASRARADSSVDYAISSGDELQLDFLNDDLEPYQLPVGDGGGVQLPFLGTVEIAGLQISEAREKIARLYVERDILVAPKIDLTVAKLRQFSVLGDVQNPGFFDYRADVTVEQAVGLAGGLIRVGTGEETLALQQAALRGELASIESSILREAVATARLRTQMAGSEKIDAGSILTDDITDFDTALINSLITQDEQIIAAEQAHFQAEQKLLKEAVADVTLQISLTEEQIIAQTDQIKSYDAELKSSAELSDRGLITAPVRARLLRQVADEHTALLRLRTNLAATRRELTGLQRELLGLAFRRAQTWRQDLGESALRTAQLRTSRVSTEERLDLLSGLIRWSVAAESKVTITYLVRRYTGGPQMKTFVVEGTNTLMSADVLIVRAERRGPSLGSADAMSAPPKVGQVPG